MTITKTTDEWPRLNQKPTLMGRWPSLISLRVALSMAAMWSASNACRMPRVYAVTPSPTPKSWPATMVLLRRHDADEQPPADDVEQEHDDAHAEHAASLARGQPGEHRRAFAARDPRSTVTGPR